MGYIHVESGENIIWEYHCNLPSVLSYFKTHACFSGYQVVVDSDNHM